jgi:hypothetical protein
MRKLSVKQKSLIKHWVIQNKNHLSIFVSVDNIPYELYSKLESLNNFETIDQEIQRYASDLINEDFRN